MSPNYVVFNFFCSSIERLPAKLEEKVGYKLNPADIVSFVIVPLYGQFKVTVVATTKIY